MNEFVAIDFETANPKRVSACAVGFALVSNGDIVEAKGHLLKPVGGHAPFQTKIHGITEEQTRDEPDFGDLFSEILPMFDYPLVAHSLFDKQVLNALAQHFCLPLSFEYTDTSALSKKRLPNLKNHKLKTLANHFELPSFKHHDATEDAIVCARIYLRLQGLSDGEVQTVGDSDQTEFKALVGGILEDDTIDYKEAYQLLYWLEDHPQVAAKQQALFVATRTALEDDHLDEGEANILRAVLRSIEGSFDEISGQDLNGVF